MSMFKKITSVSLALIFILSVVAPFALADNSIQLTSVWTANDANSLSVNQSEQAEVFVFVTSNANFQLSIDLLQGNDLTNIIGGLNVPANINAPYAQSFNIDTANLNGDYSVRIFVQSAQGNDEVMLNLDVNVPEVLVVPIVDSDGDGVADNEDNCPNVANPDQADSDGDGVGNVCDNCPEVPNADQTDTDGDGIGNVCDELPIVDSDGDGVADDEDNCPDVANTDQADTDNDGVGNVCDNCPNDANADQADTNNNGIGDVCEEVIVINTVPEINEIEIGSGLSVQETEELTFTVSANDAEGDELTFEVEEVLLEQVNMMQQMDWLNFIPLFNFNFMDDFIDPLFNKFNFIDNDIINFLMLVEGEAWNFNSVTGEFTFNPGYEYVQHPDIENVLNLQFRAFDGKDYSEWKEIEITVNDKNRIPNMNLFNADDSLEVAELGVFQAEATDADGDELTYTWNFNDGSEEVLGNDVNHTYATEGTYNVVLTVTDGFGGEVESTLEVVVVEPEQLPIEVPGCMDEDALNPNPEATVDDGSCIYPPEMKEGCTDPNAVNTDPEAVVNDGSCEYLPENVPQIISQPEDLATVGTDYSYQVDAQSNKPIQYVLTKSPVGMVVNEDGLIQWTPTKNGHFGVEVVVTDGQYATKQIYTITVRANHGSAKLASVHVPEIVVSGGFVPIYIDLTNNGNKDLEDVQITAVIYDLGLEVSSDKFDLEKGDQVGESLYLQLPHGIFSGEYLVTVSVHNEEGFSEESYRFFAIQ